VPLLSHAAHVARAYGRHLVRRVLLDALRDPIGRGVLGGALVDVITPHAPRLWRDPSEAFDRARLAALEALSDVIDAAEVAHRVKWPRCACGDAVDANASGWCNRCNRPASGDALTFSLTSIGVRAAVQGLTEGGE